MPTREWHLAKRLCSGAARSRGSGRAASNSSAAARLSMPQPSGRCRKVASVCIVSAGRCPGPSSRAGSSQATALVISSRTVPFNAARHRHDRVRSTQGGSENHPQVTLFSSYRLLDFVWARLPRN